MPLFQNNLEVLSTANLSYENEFDLHENESTGGKNIHMNEFTLTFVLTLKQNSATRKWPIAFEIHQTNCVLFYKAGKQIYF